MKTAPFRECSLEMSGPFSGALKDGVSLKAILSVNIQGGGCLSAFAIRAWWRMIIAAEERHLQEVNLTFFTFFSSCWLLLSHSPKLLFWCRKKNMFSILTYPNPFPEISSGCHEIKGSLSHQSDHTYLLWNLNRPYETLIYTRLLFLHCYCILNVSSTTKQFIQFIAGWIRDAYKSLLSVHPEFQLVAIWFSQLLCYWKQ